jgi:hypothetical protein
MLVYVLSQIRVNESFEEGSLVPIEAAHEKRNVITDVTLLNGS